MVKRSEILLEKIRMGNAMTMHEKLRLIVDLSVPSILAQITTVLMFFIDAAMVGHLGAAASASIGLIESTTWLMGSVMGAVSTGFSVQVAHFIGANDFVRARQVFRHALVCGAVVSMMILLVGVTIHGALPYWLGGGEDIAGDSSAYFLIFSLAMPFILLFHLNSAMLKSTGNMHIPSLLSITMCILDVVFNYFFIYILELGVRGAAMGTFCAFAIISLTMMWVATRRNRILALRQDTAPFTWVWLYVRNALRVGLPIAIQSALMSGAQVVSTLIVAPLGNVAIAANSFAITAESLCYMPGYGIGDAASTLVGQTYGARRADLCRNFAYMTVALGMGVMAVMGVLMYVAAPEIIGLMTPVDEIRRLGVMALRIEAFAEPMFAASIVAYGVCVGAADTLKPCLMNFLSIWAVRLTMAAWLAPTMGLRGVWIAMCVELTFRGAIFLVHLWRRRWMKAV